MNLDLSTPALLFPAVAILMLGYVNRYIGVANVVRTFVKDYDSGYKHVDIAKQLKILHNRIGVLQSMLGLGAIALMLACLSMLMLYMGYLDTGELSFGLSLLFMILSLFLSLYETSLSNKSLDIEINSILKREKN